MIRSNFKKNDMHYCEECKKFFNRLYYHIRKHHLLSNEEYAEKWRTEDWVACPECNEYYFKSLKYRNSTQGEKATCGKKKCLCAHKNKERKKTCNMIYGTDHWTQTAEAKENFSIFSKNNKLWKNFHNPARKLGYKNISQVQEIKEQKKRSCQKNFNVDWPMQSKEVQSKANKSMTKKYGVRHNFQRREVRELANKAFQKWIESNNDESYWRKRGYISKIEDAFYVWLLTQFKEEDIERQKTYKSDLLKKSFKIDFHIKCVDLWIQLDGIRWHCLDEYSSFKNGNKKDRDQLLNYAASVGELDLIRIKDRTMYNYLSGKIDEPQFYCVHLKG